MARNLFLWGFSSCQISTVFFIKYRQISLFDSSIWPEMARNLFLWGFSSCQNVHILFSLNIDRFRYLILACNQKWLEICFLGGFLVAKFPQFFLIEY